MTDRAIVERIESEWGPEEIRALAASVVGLPPEQVCDTIMVVIVHHPDGTHSFRFGADPEPSSYVLAQTLRHAADHLHGGCMYCRKRDRRRRRADGK